VKAPADPPHQGTLDIEISPMRRRHVRDVMMIERAVYPRPWSASLFFSEISQKKTRTYLVATHAKDLVGYGGLAVHLDEGHITTLAVAPEEQRRRVGARILYALVVAARDQGVRTLTLEVRVANWPAQRLYSWFGFRPVGIRRNYYAETGEDALVMWIDDLQSPEAATRLARVAESMRKPGRR
jgi:ribosomal-protein-alanine N-acetyltransferase